MCLVSFCIIVASSRLRRVGLSSRAQLSSYLLSCKINSMVLFHTFTCSIPVATRALEIPERWYLVCAFKTLYL